jgi:hypothetical protein
MLLQQLIAPVDAQRHLASFHKFDLGADAAHEALCVERATHQFGEVGRGPVVHRSELP